MVLVFAQVLSIAGTNRIGQLKQLLKNKNTSTNLFITYIKLGQEYRNAKIDSAIYFHEKAYSLAKGKLSKVYILDAENELAYDKVKNKEVDAGQKLLKQVHRRIEEVLNTKRNGNTQLNRILTLNYEYQGLTLRKKDSLAAAIDYFDKALEIAIHTKDLEAQSSLYNDLAQTYYMQGLHPRSLHYCLLGLKVNEKRKDKEGIASSTGNAGILFKELEDNKKALTYFKKALKLNQELGNKRSIAINLGNIGVAYKHLGEDDLAFEYYLKAAKMHEELGSKEGLIYNYNNIGLAYQKDNNFPKSIEYFSKSLGLAQDLNDTYSIAHTNIYLANTYVITKEFAKAQKYLDDAFEIASRIGALELLKEYYQSQADVNEGKKEFEKALRNYKKFISYKDSIVNDETFRKAVQTESKSEYEKKLLEDSIIHAKEIDLNKAELDRKNAELRADRNLQWGLYGGLALLLIFALFIFNRFKVTKKQNHIIHLQKELVEQKKQEVEAQKALVEEKQFEIISSINYAKRIQYTLLAHEDVLRKNLSDYFVLYKPKDIVSGDFYWAVEKPGGDFYLAVCDSTGHGVPGAFMGLLNTSFLNEAVIEKGIAQPNRVFDYVRTRLVGSISREGGQDGMDAILVKFEKEKLNFTYAASNNQPVLIRNGKLVELEYDKMPIGKSEKKDSFREFSFSAEKGDMLYLYTDGYIDQFGGDKGKKFMEANLIDLLIKIHTRPAEEQRIVLDNEFEAWRGHLEQIDDVCVIGVRI